MNFSRLRSLPVRLSPSTSILAATKAEIWEVGCLAESSCCCSRSLQFGHPVRGLIRRQGRVGQIDLVLKTGRQRQYFFLDERPGQENMRLPVDAVGRFQQGLQSSEAQVEQAVHALLLERAGRRGRIQVSPDRQRSRSLTSSRVFGTAPRWPSAALSDGRHPCPRTAMRGLSSFNSAAANSTRARTCSFSPEKR